MFGWVFPITWLCCYYSVSGGPLRIWFALNPLRLSRALSSPAAQGQKTPLALMPQPSGSGSCREVNCSGVGVPRGAALRAGRWRRAARPRPRPPPEELRAARRTTFPGMPRSALPRAAGSCGEAVWTPSTTSPVVRRQRRLERARRGAGAALAGSSSPRRRWALGPCGEGWFRGRGMWRA